MIVVFFCGGFKWFSVLFFSLAGTGPVCEVYVPDPARIAISLYQASDVVVEL